MWKYAEQASWPYSEEQFAARLDYIATALVAWGAVTSVQVRAPAPPPLRAVGPRKQGCPVCNRRDGVCLLSLPAFSPHKRRHLPPQSTHQLWCAATQQLLSNPTIHHRRRSWPPPRSVPGRAKRSACFWTCLRSAPPSGLARSAPSRGGPRQLSSARWRPARFPCPPHAYLGALNRAAWRRCVLMHTPPFAAAGKRTDERQTPAKCPVKRCKWVRRGSYNAGGCTARERQTRACQVDSAAARIRGHPRCAAEAGPPSSKWRGRALGGARGGASIAVY
jgi:hypothetical protein